MMIDDEELRSLYQTTGEERLQKLEAGLLHLEQHPGDEATLEVLRREIHSLKGDSRAVGLDAIATLSQQIEDLFSGIQHWEIDLTLEVSDRLYQGLHAIGKLIYEATTGESCQVDPDQALHLFTESHSAEIAPAPPYSPAETDPAETDVFQSASLLVDDQELRELYQTTSEGHLQTLNAGFRYLEHHPDDPSILETLRRTIHSLKGDSKAVGLETVVILTQQIEDVIKGIQRHAIQLTALVSDRLNDGLDAISQLIREATTGQPSGIAVDQVLDRLMEGVVMATPAPAVEQIPDVPHSAIGDQSPSLQETPQTERSAIAAQIGDVELREVYRVTSEERLQRLEASLLYLEKHPHDSSTLAGLLREAHSLKGDARSAGIDTIETLAHTIEDVLNSLQRQELELTSEVSDRLYQGLDAIAHLVQEAVTGEWANIESDQVLHHLTELLPLSPALEQAANPASPLAETTTQEASIPDRKPDEPGQIDTIRVQTRSLDALTTQTEELAVTRIQIAQTTAQIQQFATLWDEWRTNRRSGPSLGASTPSYEERLENLLLNLRAAAQENSLKLNLIAGELREQVRSLQLLPLSTVFRLLPRTVRDVSKQQAKAVELILEGGDTLTDKRILEGIKDSLMHLVRNAIDHGIELPDERERLGKPATATIRLKGYQTATSLLIEIADDGRGLDIEQIKQTAIRRGLYHPAELETMPLSQIQSLILAPGFSTRTFITELSGRGVGLDVVRTQVEQLQGSIQIESTPGQGCTFRLQLSTALSTANVVLVDVQGIVFALPIEFLQTTLLVSPEQVATTEGKDSMMLDDQSVPVANLIDVLELTRSPAYQWRAKQDQPAGDRRPCIVLRIGDDQAGFLVDRLIDQQEVVIKPQSRLLKRVRNVMGATILGTGEVCMILNPPDLIRSLQRHPLSETPARSQPTTNRQPVILLVEDSPPVRIQEKRLFEGAGYEVVTAIDGLEGYTKLRTRNFDAIVSDVEMPNLDGLSLTAKIRQQPDYQELPIILVTTLSSNEDRQRGAKAGANAYILKDKFNQDILLETLKRLIQSRI